MLKSYYTLRKKKRKLEERIINLSLKLTFICVLPLLGIKGYNYLKYADAPVIEYKVQKGDRLWDYFKRENTKKDLNFKEYSSEVIRKNDFYISGLEKNINPSGKLVAGRIVSLIDVNRDGFVGGVVDKLNDNNKN